jgi:transposase-like protein
MEAELQPQLDVNATGPESVDRAAGKPPADAVADALPHGAVDHDENDGLTPQQMRLIAVLATSTNVQAASREVEINRSTAYQWMKQPAFHDELQRQRNAILKEALVNVKINATRAAAELVGLLDEDDPGLRRLVCRDILDRASRIYDMENIETRLAAMEKALKQQHGARS